MVAGVAAPPKLVSLRLAGNLLRQQFHPQRKHQTNHDNHLGASSGRLPEAVANDSIATALSVGEIDSDCFFVRTQPRVAIAAKTQGLSIPSCVGNQPPTLIKGWLANQCQRLLGNSNTL